MDYSTLRCFIVKHIANGLSFHEGKRKYVLSFRTITDTIRRQIIQEASKWGLNETQADAFINKTLNEINTINTVNYQSCQSINIRTGIRLGQELLLHGSEAEKGMAELHIMFIGKTSMNTPEFLVLESSRGHLHPDDILQPADDCLWAVGYPLRFRVFRDGHYYPSSHLVYQTYLIDNIEKRTYSILHEAIDSLKDFTYQEHMSISLDGKSICYGKNPMSFLLHNYSTKAPVYFDVDKTKQCSYYSNHDVFINPSDNRNIFFNINKDGDKYRSIKIETIVPGKMHIEDNNCFPIFDSPAKTKVIE